MSEAHIEDKAQNQSESDNKAAGTILSQEAFKSSEESAGSISPRVAHQQRYQVIGNRAIMLGSEHADIPAKAVSDVNPKSEMSVSLYLKSKASEAEIEQTLQKIADGKQADYKNDPQGFIDKFGADPKAVKQVESFAKTNGLKISSEDVASGRVVLTGSTAQIEKAFDTKLANFQDNKGSKFVSHVGDISLPAKMADNVTAILGLDGRPMGESHALRLDQTTVFGPHDNSFKGYMPQDVAKLYDFPMEKGGAGQGVAIVELAGGLDLKDNAQYYKDHNLPEPKINVIEIDGNKNSPTKDPNGPDGEVALDSQVVGAVAPKATQNLIFTSIDDKGFVDGITRSVFQPAGETPNAAVSVSWGKPESGWTDDAAAAMRSAIQKAALKGINVYVAAGDQGANDRAPDYQVDMPSATPEAIGVGGTNIAVKDGKITSETVWNDGTDWMGNPEAGGGGISQRYPVPDYQKDLKMPPNLNKTNKPGRGVPDVSADSDPQSGYTVRIDGTETVIGGTSAAAPLDAALNALLNTELGHSAGWLNPKLYKFEKTNPEVFRDITQGNNAGYDAGPGWDAASGLGSIQGNALLKALKADEAPKK